jgi:hypothetical protein
VMATREALAEWHVKVYGIRPAFFTANYCADCSWCGTPIVKGDDVCYWPEADMDVAHEGCLWALWKADR